MSLCFCRKLVVTINAAQICSMTTAVVAGVTTAPASQYQGLTREDPEEAVSANMHTRKFLAKNVCPQDTIRSLLFRPEQDGSE